MRYPKEIVKRNVRVRELLNEVWDHSIYTKSGFVTYIDWGNVPLRTIKELIELETMDLERNRFLTAPISKRDRNLLIHRK